jgi:hypothetical protein
VGGPRERRPLLEIAGVNGRLIAAFSARSREVAEAAKRFLARSTSWVFCLGQFRTRVMGGRLPMSLWFLVVL